MRANPALAPATPVEMLVGWAEFDPLFRYVLPLVSIFVVVVGAMSGGIATPTELAALGALATMALAAAYGALNLEAMRKALHGTIGISGMILFIILGATTFSQILSFSGATEGIVSAIFSQQLSTFAILTGMMALLIFLGLFVDQVSMMLITLPVFMPIVQRLDVDLIWFGVLYLICMQLGLLLPPHGLLLMTMRGVAPPQVSMAHIFRAVVPYILLSLVLLVMIIIFPAVATWLPASLGESGLRRQPSRTSLISFVRRVPVLPAIDAGAPQAGPARATRAESQSGLVGASAARSFVTKCAHLARAGHAVRLAPMRALRPDRCCHVPRRKRQHCGCPRWLIAVSCRHVRLYRMTGIAQ